MRLIIPIYNDWDSFAVLLRELDRVAAHLSVQVSVSALLYGLLFKLLNSRVQRLIFPIADFKCYIDQRESLLAQVPNEA